MRIRHYINIITEALKNPLDNPEFANWFNDSKVVDSSGNPLVVYHGTEFEFEYYNRWPIYFTPDKRIASEYAMNKGLANSDESVPNVRPVYLRVVNPVIIDERKLALMIDDENGDRNWDHLDYFANKYLKSGYDGIYLHNVLDYSGGNQQSTERTHYDQWVIFDTDQIWPVYRDRPDPSTFK